MVLGSVWDRYDYFLMGIKIGFGKNLSVLLGEPISLGERDH
jgi:hypothetical protein